MANSVAVDRRRASRRNRSDRRKMMERRRLDYERLVSVRMTDRLIEPELRRQHLLLFIDYRYWQARACGWDVLKPEYRRNGRGDVVGPAEGTVWAWWIGLHYQTRNKLHLESRMKRASI